MTEELEHGVAVDLRAPLGILVALLCSRRCVMDKIALQSCSPNRSIGCHSPEGDVRSRGGSRGWSLFAPGWRIAALSMAAVLMMTGSAPAEPPTDQQVTLTATDYAFSPKEIRVVTGRPMTLTFVNRGEHTHGLRLVLSYGEVPLSDQRSSRAKQHNDDRQSR